MVNCDHFTRNCQYTTLDKGVLGVCKTKIIFISKTIKYIEMKENVGNFKISFAEAYSAVPFLFLLTLSFSLFMNKKKELSDEPENFTYECCDRHEANLILDENSNDENDVDDETMSGERKYLFLII